VEDHPTTPSARELELLELSYAFVLEHGISELSLRPLASAIGSSPRVLLFLFGSKDGLVRRLLERARRDQLDYLASHRAATTSGAGLGAAVATVWEWLARPAHRPLLRLWLEAYARSLVEPAGPWGSFAERTVEDWLDVLAAAQPAVRGRSARGRAERTLALAVLRGALLDLLATGDSRRTGAAVAAYADGLD
jgi:AcrR family transcriptional regulator